MSSSIPPLPTALCLLALLLPGLGACARRGAESTGDVAMMAAPAGSGSESSSDSSPVPGATPPAARFTAADYDQHIAELRKTLPRGFTIVVSAPFVVVGDEAPARVRSRAEATVAWAVKGLKASYFEKDPLEILTVWLFKDRKSYEENVWKLFGTIPTTPFGYYSEENRALIMNIATGGGTLVHEIVHPFMQANFPACPSWFNEGLASLYEQSGRENGRIRGYTNWRLAGLQKAIRAGNVPSFKTLLSTTENQFYSEDSGTNYAQARYLCYYLQEKGLLRRYYREFVSNHVDDPSGYDTLKAVLGRDDDGMPTFRKEWERFVLGLRFGNP